MIMVDILVLEDNRGCRLAIFYQIPDTLRSTFVKNSREFKQYLGNNGRADRYFLDNEVPDDDGIPTGQFIYHADILLDKMPDSRIVYIGGTLSTEIEQYCQLHRIPMVNKSKVGKYIKENLKSEEYQYTKL